MFKVLKNIFEKKISTFDNRFRYVFKAWLCLGKTVNGVAVPYGCPVSGWCANAFHSLFFTIQAMLAEPLVAKADRYIS